jgi:hypothetical protein
MKRKPKSYTESRGNVTGYGDTRALARADMNRLIDWTLKQTGPTIESRFGLVIAVAPVVAGWSTRVFDPAQCAHGEIMHFAIFEGPGEYADVIDRARSHAAQLAWHAAVNDAEHSQASGCSTSRQDDIKRWAKFQRDNARYKAEGKTDGEAHALACGYA